MAILDEALEVGHLVGDRQAVSQVPVMHSWFAIRCGDWPAALRAALDAIDQKMDFGDLSMLPGIFGEASIALARLQALESSAMLYGAKDAAPFYPAEWRDEFARVEVTLVDGLGAERFEALRASGAAMAPVDVVAYLRAEAARVLSDD